MSDKRYEVLDRFSPLFNTPDPSIQEFLRRRERKRRNQRIAAGVVGIAIFVVPLLVFAVLISPDRNGTPAGIRPTSPPASSDVPKGDYVLDLRTGEMSPIPFIRDVGGSVLYGQYAASPGGSRLAYVGVKENGSRQIFVVPVDGRHPQQVTHLPRDFSPASPAWSPDGTQIVYEGYASGTGRNVFVLEVATGESTRVINPGPFDLGPSCPTCLVFPQFTPDGSSIVYTGEGGGSVTGVARIVRAAGGKSRILIGASEGLNGVFATSLSPDGSLVTFQGSGWPRPGFHCGPCRFLANTDGTDRRVIPGGESSPAGTWSPDGRRIVAADAVTSNRIIVVDVATGQATPVAEGLEAIWLDNHTLLIETDPTL
jgi:hypothetical protein